MEEIYYQQREQDDLIVHNIYTDIRKYIKYLNIEKVRLFNSLFQTKTQKYNNSNNSSMKQHTLLPAFEPLEAFLLLHILSWIKNLLLSKRPNIYIRFLYSS